MFQNTVFLKVWLTGISVLVFANSAAGQCSQGLRDSLADLIVWNIKWREGSPSTDFTALNGQSVYVLESDSQVSFVSARLRLNATIKKSKSKYSSATLGEYYSSDNDESIISRVLSPDSAGPRCLQLKESEIATETQSRDAPITLPNMRICEKTASASRLGDRHVTVRSCPIQIPIHNEMMPIVRTESKALVKTVEAAISDDMISNSVSCNRTSLIIPHMSVFAPWIYALVENGCKNAMNTIYMIYRDGNSYVIGRQIPYASREFSRLATLIRESGHEKIEVKIRKTVDTTTPPGR